MTLRRAKLCKGCGQLYPGDCYHHGCKNEGCVCDGCMIYFHDFEYYAEDFE